MTDLDTLTRQVERSSNKEIRLPKATVLALLDVARAAEEFEREYQRQRGAVNNEHDWLMLTELQTRYREARAKLGEQA